MPEGQKMNLSLWLLFCALLSHPLGSTCVASELGVPGCQERGGGAPAACR